MSYYNNMHSYPLDGVHEQMELAAIAQEMERCKQTGNMAGGGLGSGLPFDYPQFTPTGGRNQAWGGMMLIENLERAAQQPCDPRTVDPVGEPWIRQAAPLVHVPIQSNLHNHVGVNGWNQQVAGPLAGRMPNSQSHLE